MVAEVTMDDGFVDSSDEEDDMIDVGDLYHDEDEDEEEDEVEDSEDECNGNNLPIYNCNYQLFVYIFAMYKTYITFFYSFTRHIIKTWSTCPIGMGQQHLKSSSVVERRFCPKFLKKKQNTYQKKVTLETKKNDP